MSLDFNFNKIKNWKEVTRKKIADDVTQEQIKLQIRNGASYYYEEDEEGNKIYTSYMNPVTNALIWACMAVDMGSITQKNYPEFWLRCAMDDGDSGSGRILEGEGRHRSVTLEEVREHIGLSTNVSTQSKTYFYNKLLKRAQRFGYVLDRQEEAA